MSYITIEVEWTTCPDCGSQPSLLFSQTCNKSMPSFYVCQCGCIGQVGVGLIRRGFANVPLPDQRGQAKQSDDV